MKPQIGTTVGYGTVPYNSANYYQVCVLIYDADTTDATLPAPWNFFAARPFVGGISAPAAKVYWKQWASGHSTTVTPTLGAGTQAYAAAPAAIVFGIYGPTLNIAAGFLNFCWGESVGMGLSPASQPVFNGRADNAALVVAAAAYQSEVSPSIADVNNPEYVGLAGWSNSRWAIQAGVLSAPGGDAAFVPKNINPYQLNKTTNDGSIVVQVGLQALYRDMEMSGAMVEN